MAAPGLTGIKPDEDPDDLDFDELPDPDLNKVAAGGIFVFEYSGAAAGPNFTLYERTGLVMSPDLTGSSRVYRRLGEAIARLKLSEDAEESLGDDVNLLFSELTVQRTR